MKTQNLRNTRIPTYCDYMSGRKRPGEPKAPLFFGQWWASLINLFTKLIP